MTSSESAATFAPKLLALTLGCVLALTGCLVGPNYHRPSVDAPTAWKEQPPEGWKTATPQDEIAKGNWWAVFGDPDLDRLETQAVAANLNLQAAAQRVLEARAQALATKSNLYPDVSAGFSPSRARNSGTRIIAGGETSVYDANTFSLPVQATYEADLW